MRANHHSFDWVRIASESPDEVVLDKDSWVGRCAECLTELSPAIEHDEAIHMARAMWSLERFRRRGPDAVAALLMSNPAIRP
ncbi:MAG TPA: hypothetical protein VGP22_04965 [Albitalea sp.]|jgi:hypothetical protein|nr:hypothetical protein [Albitalea sp.]